MKSDKLTIHLVFMSLYTAIVQLGQSTQPVIKWNVLATTTA